MRVLVTGNAGYIGRHMCQLLKREGHDIVGCDEVVKPAQSIHRLNDYHMSVYEPKIDAVLHLAAIAKVQQCESNPSAAYHTNVGGTAAAINFAVRCEIPRFVFASSLAAADVPRTVYGKTKAAGEALLWKSNSFFPKGTASLRFGNVAGSYDPSVGRVIPAIMRSYLTGETFQLQARSDYKRNFVHVEDVAEACLHFLKSDCSGTFDICTDRCHTLEGLIKAFDWWAGETDEAGEPLAVETGLVRRDDEEPSVSCSPLSAKLRGWTAKRTLEDIFASVRLTDE